MGEKASEHGREVATAVAENREGLVFRARAGTSPPPLLSSFRVFASGLVAIDVPGEGWAWCHRRQRGECGDQTMADGPHGTEKRKRG
jgi:hypothetical protein